VFLTNILWRVIEQTPWVFTTVEVIHVFAVAMVLGTISIMDLRLLGIAAVFWIKMVLIAAAGIKMIIFEFITVRGVQQWNLAPTPPQPARLAGGISITCWVLVLLCGRLIAFTCRCQSEASQEWAYACEKGIVHAPAKRYQDMLGQMPDELCRQRKAEA
jgi:hypothetical protein